MALPAAIVSMCVAAVVAAAQDDARVPEITSTYTIDRENGYTEFCVEINADRLQDKIYDVEFTGSWAPPITTPPERFGPPGEWEWEPFGGGGWQAKTGVAMALGTRYCFRVPVTAVPDPVTLTASTKTAAGQHQQYLTFLSRPPDYRAVLGDVPRTFTYGGEGAAGIGLLEPADATCRPDPVEDEFVFATPKRGQLTIRRSGTAETAAGRVDARGHFAASGETASYTGTIGGRIVVFGYRDGRRPACEQSFIGRAELNRNGRTLPACARPSIVAPNRARVARGRVRLRIGATCAGAPLARWPIAVTLRSRGRTFAVGSFRTLLVARGIVVRLGSTRSREIAVHARASRGLAASVKRIRLVYD